jgi:hypothetical protein
MKPARTIKFSQPSDRRCATFAVRDHREAESLIVGMARPVDTAVDVQDQPPFPLRLRLELPRSCFHFTSPPHPNCTALPHPVQPNRAFSTATNAFALPPFLESSKQSDDELGRSEGFVNHRHRVRAISFRMNFITARSRILHSFWTQLRELVAAPYNAAGSTFLPSTFGNR